MKITLLTVLAAALFACSGGDEDGNGDADGAADGEQVIACTNAGSCTEMHFPATSNGSVYEGACVDYGGVASDACEVSPAVGCCVVQNGDAKTCYFGEAYASADSEVLSQACASAGGQWQM